MSLRLILMRHAKSDWGTPARGDFYRPLNKRGRRDAATIGGWLSAKGYGAQAVLCSAALRTRETWALVAAQSHADPTVDFLKSLYLASPDEMFHEIAKLKDATTVLMLAHNPGTAILARALADRVPAHARFDDHPTAATTVFDFAIDNWADLAPGQGQVVDFVVPRDLAGSLSDPESG